MSDIILILAILAYFATVWNSFRSFRQKKYGFYFDIVGSLFLAFSFDYLKFTLNLNWFYSFVLPVIVYLITLVIVKKISNTSRFNN